MTNERSQELWDQGWKAFWDGKPQSDCPDNLTSEERDEWVCAWLTAQNADLQDPYAHL